MDMANGFGSLRSRMNFNPKCYTYVFGCHDFFIFLSLFSFCVCVLRGGSLLDGPKNVYLHFKSICTTHDMFDVINNCDMEDLATLLVSYMRSLQAHSKLF